MAAHLGQTFVTPQAPGVLPHLWTVLSDPSQGERVVLANVAPMEAARILRAQGLV